MSDTPNNLLYTKTHEWILKNDDGTITVGITDHAQELLGDMVFVEVPDVDAEFTAGDEIAVVESVKAASDVYTPVGGRVVEVNEHLANSPELVNNSPYDEGWIFRLEVSDEGELDTLLDHEQYQEQIDAEEEH